MSQVEKPIDAADVTWKVAGTQTWKFGALYRERMVRDWKWLWLRKKFVTEYMGHIEFDS